MSGIVSKNAGRGSGIVGTGAIGADAVDSSNIADNAIDSEHYTDGSIDNAHIADNAIDSEHYADGSIDNAHIADDAIDSEHYADGSIDNAHIADDAIDSEHYADGSIDTAHIATNQIDETLIKDAFVGDFTDATVTASDYFIHGDATDSGNTKKDTIQGILDLASGGATLGTPVASTSGTSIDFTSIPSGTKRITISYSGVSTTGTSKPIVQLGDAGGVETSGYLGAGFRNGATVANFTDGFGIHSDWASGVIFHGITILVLLDSSTYTWSGGTVHGRSDATHVGTGGGAKSLSAELDRVRITTQGGSETFDAGKINILYE